MERKVFDKVIKGHCTIPSYSLTAIVGRSGAGKTTTLHMIAGIINPDSGSIRVNQQLVNDLPPSLRPVSMLFQNHNLFPHLNVQNNIGIALSAGLTFSEVEIRSIYDVLENVGLQGYEQRYPDSLSVGEQQRVALARALLRDKPFLLLDEPFSACDPGMRKQLMSLLIGIHKTNKLTTIISTHHLEEIKDVIHNLIFIDSNGMLHYAETYKQMIDSAPPEFRDYMYGNALFVPSDN